MGAASVCQRRDAHLSTVARGRAGLGRGARGRDAVVFQAVLEGGGEYGVTLGIAPDGAINLIGISDLQTNGAGTGTGYLLGRKIDSGRRAELESMARIVGARLFREGYTGPAGVDALEHTRGLHPLLEINARYTMGSAALAPERTPTHP